MDGLPSPPELSSDIQRALQRAVGQANNAFTSRQVADQTSPTRRKHAREEPPTERVEVVKQKKKRKRVAENVHTSPQGPPVNTAVDKLGPRSKKRKTTSSKLPAQVATDVSNVTELQPQVSFSAVGVPDLEYASNDDILRALQDLDVTKIATVLKTLGEAAAAANLPLTSLSSTITQRPLSAPPTSSTPSNPVVPTRRVPQHHRRHVHVSSQPLAHSDHADVLATKWLSASKLAELARTQGKY